MESQILGPGISQASASPAHGDLGVVVSMLARGADSASAQRQCQRRRACFCFRACRSGHSQRHSAKQPRGGCCATHQRRVSDQPAGAVVGRRLRSQQYGSAPVALYEPASDSCSGPRRAQPRGRRTGAQSTASTAMAVHWGAEAARPLAG